VFKKYLPQSTPRRNTEKHGDKNGNMDHIKIRGKPPWYARGTPVTKLRDGPAKRTRGKPPLIECRNAGMQECKNVGMHECVNAEIVECRIAGIRGKPPFYLSSRRGTRRDLQQWKRFLIHASFEMTAEEQHFSSG